MLKAQKKITLTVVPHTHVDLYVEHYDMLKGWALSLTKYDHELAEDLLHDAFIHFTLTKPDLAAVQNIESYLYVIMRNLHLSQIRKATRIPTRSLSVIEYDTVDLGMWASDPRDRLKLRDDLGAICQYACIRKETLKAASVLILRFFHGYYPEEIAEVMRTTRAMVDNRLRRVRAEVRAYLETPDRVSFIDEQISKTASNKVEILGADLRLDLRREIFNSRKGGCFPTERVSALYASKGAESIDVRTLAHGVSCPDCIETINSLLGLPPLASRYPLDTIGKDPGPKDRTGGGGAGGGAGGSSMLDSYINRRDAFYHHQPEELCISVNGLFQGAHRVAADKNEMRLVIDTSETVGFVEIFSEQGLRLLMLNVEPPPAGDGAQSISVELSSGRTLGANLDFSGQFPTLQVNYNDPELSEFAVIEASTAPNAEQPIHVPFENATESTFFDRIKTWFQPLQLAVAATVLLAAMAGFWFISQPTPVEPATARSILKQARDAEFSLAPTADKVLHRNYQVEVWANGELNSRRRVDEWQKQKATARRTYDEQGRMIAGRWIGEDGKQQVFEQGQKLRTVSRGPSAADEYVESVTPTANAFANLIDRHGVTAKTTLDESATAYIFNFEDRNGETAQTGINERLIAATLTLDKNTYMPTSQTIVLQVGGEQREYRFSDVRLEQKPVSEVSPLIFVPEAELSKGATVVTKPLDIELPTADLANKTTTTNSNPTAASLDTEVEVFRALDSVNALSGDQVTIERNAAGQVRVTGIVDTAQRKTEILNALSGLRNAPGLTINVQTAAEAASAKKNTGTITPIDVDTNASVSTNLPVEDELKAHFERRGVTGDKLNEQITTYANGVLNRSDSLRRNALSLKRLAERFSPAELERLEPARRDQWKALLRSKAAAVAGDARSLSSQLSAAGLGSGGGAGGGAAIRDASGVAEAAQRLFGLGVECDAEVRQSFSISRGGSGSASVKTVQFWRNLNQIAAIAEGIQKY